MYIQVYMCVLHMLWVDGVVVDELIRLQISMCHLFICVVLSQLMQDEHGETALFTACSQGHYDPAALLIDHGTDVNYLRKVRLSLVHVQPWWQNGVLSLEQGARLSYNYVHGHHGVHIIDA